MSYRYMDHSELAELMASDAKAGKDYQVVDVRDHDRAGGHITGSINEPSEQRTEQSVQELVAKLDAVPKVIFHCALSQVRGPKAARIYAEAREAASLSALISHTSSHTSSPSTAPESAPNASANAPSAGSDSASSAFSPNPFTISPKKREQEVLVLRDGFEGWQSLYRKDPKLVEAFDEALWGSYAA